MGTIRDWQVEQLDGLGAGQLADSHVVSISFIAGDTVLVRAVYWMAHLRDKG